MKINLKNLLKNSIFKTIIAFVFVLMCLSIMLPVNAFASSESITGKLTLELASSGGGGDIVPSGGGSESTLIDASITSSTGAFDFLPIIFAIFALALFIVLLYSLFTGRFKNKTLSIFALCLVVSIGVCGTKTLIANADNVGVSDNQGISSSAYLKFDEAGKVLENKLDITNNTDSTINIENITCDSEYASIFPDLAGIKITGNSSYEGKLNCDVVPASLIEKARESQGKAEIEGFFSVNFNKEQPAPTCEAYAYKDTSKDEETTLVLTYDNDKATHDTVYKIAANAKEATDWEWNDDRKSFTKVKINENFKNYTGLTSTAYMFASFENITEHEGFKNINTSNVTNMTGMFCYYGQNSTTLNTVPDVSSWDTTNVTNMNGIFCAYGFSAVLLNAVPDISNWDTSKVTNMSTMFSSYGYNSTTLNTVPGVSSWNTTNVTDMSEMFSGYGYQSTSLNVVPDVSSWDTANVTNMSEMFYLYNSKESTVFSNLNLSNFNTNKVTAYSSMLDGLKLESITLGASFNMDLSSTGADLCNSSNTKDATWYDDNGTSYEKCSMGEKTRTTAVTYRDTKPLHPEAYGYKDTTSEAGQTILVLAYDSIRSSHENTYDIKTDATQSSDWSWDKDRESFTKVTINENFKNYSELTSTSCMFSDFKNVSAHVGYENINTANVTNMSSMFSNYGDNSTSLNAAPDVSTWDTKNVTNMSMMFSDYGCNSSNAFELDLSSFNTTNAGDKDHMLTMMKLKSIKISPNFTLKFNDCQLTNSSGQEGATWYDENINTYTPSTLPVGSELSSVVTYYDHDPREAYGYKDITSEAGQTTLVITYDTKKSTHDTTYSIPTAATQASDWGWNNDRASFTKVTINDNFQNYTELTSTCHMFEEFQNVTSQEGFEYINTSNVTNMSYMFNCYGYLTEDFNTIPDVSNWDTSKVTNMAGMFSGYGWSSTNLKLVPNMTSWTTSSLIDITGMIAGYGSKMSFECLDLSSFDTTNIKQYALALNSMKLKSIKISTKFKLSLSTVNLTNSSGSVKPTTTWYDESCNSYAASALPVGSELSSVVTYYDHDPREAYGYKDTTSEDNATTLVITYDTKKPTHDTTYSIPTAATQASDWGWSSERTSFTKVTIDENFKNYIGLTSTAYMFSDFENIAEHEGFKNINTTNVINMESMFLDYGRDSTLLNAVPDVSGWTTTNVTNMSMMFWNYGYSSTLLNAVPDVSGWTTTNVTNMSYMFYSYGYNSTTLNTVPNVSNWDTTNVKGMSHMFYNYGYESTSSFSNLNLSNFNTNKVTNYSEMLNGFKLSSITLGSSFSKDLTSSGAVLCNSSRTSNAIWYDSNGTAYANCSMGEISRTTAVTYYDTNPVQNEAYGYKDTTSEDNATTLVLTFDGQRATHNNTYDIPTAATESSSWGWNGDRKSFTKVQINENFKNYTGLTSTAYMFSDFENISEHEGFENINTSNVTNMSYMFFEYGYKSTSINTVPDVSNWKTTNVIDMSYMFSSYGYNSTSAFFLNLSSFNTVKVTSYTDMLDNFKLKSITLGANFSMDLTSSGAKLCNSSTTKDATWYDSDGNTYASCSMGTEKRTTAVTYFDTTPGQPEAYGYKDTTSEDNATTLVLTFDGQRATHKNTYDIPTAATDENSWGWNSDRESFTKVTIDENFKNYTGLTSTTYMFYNFLNVSDHTGYENINTTNVTNMSSMFEKYGENSTKLNEVPDVSNWKTTNVTDMSSMFYGYNYYGSSVFSLNLSNFDTTNVTSYRGMLEYLKLSSITLGSSFSMDLTSSGAKLCNSSNRADTTWYDSDFNTYAKCSMGKEKRTQAVTYYDHDPREAYGYKDTTSEGNATTLVLTYDSDRSSHGTTYNMPTAVIWAGSWDWYNDRESFTKVKINENFKNYTGLTSTSYMFYSFLNVTEHSGYKYINTTNVTDMSLMFMNYGSNSASLNTVPDVSSWNITNVTNMSSMFQNYGYNSTSLNTVPDVTSWNTTNVTNMSYVFSSYGYNSTTLNTVPDVSNWNTTNVTDMSSMFQNYGYESTSAFSNLNLSSFNTDKVTNCSNMLYDFKLSSITLGSDFSMDLTSSGAKLCNSSRATEATWYDSDGKTYASCSMGTEKRDQAVTYYDHDPREAYGYKDTTSEAGQTTLVLTFDEQRATHNKTYDIPTAATSADSWGWNGDRISFTKVQINENFKNYTGLTSTSYMFYDCSKVSEHAGYEYINTTNVVNMTSMFDGYGWNSSSLNSVPDVSSWNTKNVTDMSSMFRKYGQSSTSLNSVPDVSSWNTTNVTNMSMMFNNYGYNSTSAFTNLNLSNFNTKNVTECFYMLNGLKLSSITLGIGFNMDLTSSGASLNNSSGTSNAKWYDGDGTSYINCSMGTITMRTKAVTYFDTMPGQPKAYGYKDTTSEDNATTLVITYDTEKSSHDTTYDIPTAASTKESWGWYNDRESFTKVTINENFKNYTGLTSTSYMFYNFMNVSDHAGYEYINTTNVTNMRSMFENYGYNSTSLDKVPDVSNWNTTNVTNMESMFDCYGYSSTSLNTVPDVSNWNTKNVTDMTSMFYCYGRHSTTLKTVPDVSNWDTSRVYRTFRMFCDYGSEHTVFLNIDFSNWDTRNITDRENYDEMLRYMKLKSITIGPNWDLALAWGDWSYTEDCAYLTNRKGEERAYWYDGNGTSHKSWSMGQEIRTAPTTYYDTNNKEVYAYKDNKTPEDQNTLVLTYDLAKARHEGIGQTVYEIPKSASWPEDWKWNNDRKKFNRVQIDESFKNYTGLTSTSYMFSDFVNVTSHEGFENINTTNVTNMSQMFADYGHYSTSLNVVPDVSNWNTSNVKDMSYMFWQYGANTNTSFDCLNLSGFDSRNLQEKGSFSMFYGMKLKSITLGPCFVVDLSDSGGALTNSKGETDARWFDGNGTAYPKCSMGTTKRTQAVTYYDLWTEAYGYKDISESGQTTLVITYDKDRSSHGTTYDIPTAATQASDWGWNNDRSSFTKVTINDNFQNYTGLTSTAYMFSEFNHVSENEEFQYLNTSNVTNMSSMFQNYGFNSTSFNKVPDISNWNTTNVTNMSFMFYSYGYNSSSLDKVPDISNWNTTNVKNMSSMFCSYGQVSTSLNTVPDVSSWNTTNVTDMSSMFQNYGYGSTSAFTNLNLSNFDTTNVTSYSNMLNCFRLSSITLGTSFKLDLTSSGASLSNSINILNTTWYDSNGIAYAKCSMGTEHRDQAVTYFDTPQTDNLNIDENLAIDEVSTNQSIDNTFNNIDSQNNEVLAPDTHQDKSSSTEDDNKDKATDKTDDSQSQENSTAEETTSVSSMLVNFTSSLTSFSIV